MSTPSPEQPSASALRVPDTPQPWLLSESLAQSMRTSAVVFGTLVLGAALMGQPLVWGPLILPLILTTIFWLDARGDGRETRMLLDTMRTEGVWCAWHIPPDPWTAHWAREPVNRWRAPLVVLGLLVVFAVLLAVEGRAPAPSPLAYGPALTPWQRASPALIPITLLCVLVLLMDHGVRVARRRVVQHGGIVWFGPTGLLIGGEFVGLSRSIRTVRLLVEPAPMLEIELDSLPWRLNGRRGFTVAMSPLRRERVWTVPVPPGRVAEARAVVARFAVGG